MARLDRLPRARELAQLMAVIGREVEAEFVASVMGRSLAMVAPDLAALATAAVLQEDAVPGGWRYAFRHALLQDAALQSLLAPRRRAWHEQVARTLVARSTQGIAEVDPAEVARHADGAGLDDWAARWWRQAAEKALGESGGAASARIGAKELARCHAEGVAAAGGPRRGPAPPHDPHDRPHPCRVSRQGRRTGMASRQTQLHSRFRAAPRAAHA